MSFRTLKCFKIVNCHVIIFIVKAHQNNLKLKSCVAYGLNNLKTVSEFKNVSAALKDHNGAAAARQLLSGAGTSPYWEL